MARPPSVRARRLISCRSVGSRPGDRTKPGIHANGAENGAYTGASQVPVSARCWVGAISGQVASGTATAASNSSFLMAFLTAVDRRYGGQG